MRDKRLGTVRFTKFFLKPSKINLLCLLANFLVVNQTTAEEIRFLCQGWEKFTFPEYVQKERNGRSPPFILKIYENDKTIHLRGAMVPTHRIAEKLTYSNDDEGFYRTTRLVSDTRPLSHLGPIYQIVGKFYFDRILIREHRDAAHFYSTYCWKESN